LGEGNLLKGEGRKRDDSLISRILNSKRGWKKKNDAGKGDRQEGGSRLSLSNGSQGEGSLGGTPVSIFMLKKN